MNTLGIYNSYRFGYGPRPYGGYYAGYTNPFYANTPLFTSPVYYYGNPFPPYRRPYAMSPIFDYYGYRNPAYYYGFDFGFRYQQPYQYNFGNYYSVIPFNYLTQLSNVRKYSSNPYASTTSYTSSDSSTKRTHTKISKKTSTPKKTTTASKPPTVSKALDLAKQELKKGVHETSNDNSPRIIEYRSGSDKPEAASPWCASFASWLYGAGQGRTCPFGYSQSSGVIAERAINAGYYARANSGYRPKVGDLMIIQYPKKNGKYQGGHVGIVVEVNSDGTYVTIEGNYSDKVARVKRSMNTEDLHGFVKMGDWIKNS